MTRMYLNETEPILRDIKERGYEALNDDKFKKFEQAAWSKHWGTVSSDIWSIQHVVEKEKNEVVSTLLSLAKVILMTRVFYNACAEGKLYRVKLIMEDPKNWCGHTHGYCIDFCDECNRCGKIFCQKRLFSICVCKEKLPKNVRENGLALAVKNGNMEIIQYLKNKMGVEEVEVNFDNLGCETCSWGLERN